MITDTRGIVLRQVKTVNGRRMLLLFTEKFGKISVGTTISEKGRGKNALALRPFSYGNYELFRSKGYYNLNKGQVIKSFYGIGEDVDKYMCASYGLELCDRLMEEEAKDEEAFRLTVEFLAIMERRKSKYETVLLAYKIKLLKLLGYFPELKQCVGCGSGEELDYFSVEEGGMLCKRCFEERKKDEKYSHKDTRDKLIYRVDFGILTVLYYFIDNPIGKFEKLALDDDLLRRISDLTDRYITYHLSPGTLKSRGNFG